ncbi:MAG: nuclear transport factor 2 family protein [Pseudomonadota bacterium]
MSASDNKKLVEEAWGMVSVGDAEGFLSKLADDATWTFFGSHRFAGTFDGKAEIIAKLFEPLGEVLEDGIKVTINSLTAEGDRVIMESKGLARTKAGVDYNNDYCIVITVKDGLIVAVREYLDTELVTAAFGK